MILVSYVPLLRGDPGRLVTVAKAQELMATGAGHVDAVVWTLDDDVGIVPILALPRGTEIFEHLVEWSEGSPASWFYVEYEDDQSEYALAVVPNVERSVQRFTLARERVTGVEQSLDTDIVVAFEPLLFYGPLSDASRRALSTLRESVTVGIVDVAALGSRTAPTLPENPATIGPLRCVRRVGLLKVAMNSEGFAM